MALTTIHPNGTSTVTVPATESIAISNYGGGIASIYYLVENANRPNAFQLQQTLENAGVVLGAFADGKTVKIEAGGSTVVFDVGASPDTGIGDADTLNGLASDTTDTADTIAARDSNGDITANAFESTVTTGTAPLTVASTTVVSNLNAELLDGQQGSYYAVDSLAAHLAGTEIFTGAKTFSVNPTISGTSPYLQIVESDTTTNGRFAIGGGVLNIQIGAAGSGGSGSGDLRICGYDVTNIGHAYIRSGGIDNEIWHQGNDSILAKTNANNEFSTYQLLSNNVFLNAKETDNTIRTLIGMNNSDQIVVGDASQELLIRTNGTLKYNGTTLASGSIDTTAAQTITVVDGLITSIT